MVILRHRLPGGWLRSIEDRFQGPEISVAHDLAERLFDLQGRGCRPARWHSRTPAACPLMLSRPHTCHRHRAFLGCGNGKWSCRSCGREPDPWANPTLCPKVSQTDI